jgi:hypothetical protein
MKRTLRLFALGIVGLLSLGAVVSLAARGPGHAIRAAARATVAPAPAPKKTTSPARLCTTQRTAMGAAAFNQVWASNASAPRKAMGACTSYMAKAQRQSRAAGVEARVLAAVKTCKAQRQRTPAAFNKRFGSTRRTSALGKCVRSRSGIGAGRSS